MKKLQILLCLKILYQIFGHSSDLNKLLLTINLSKLSSEMGDRYSDLFFLTKLNMHSHSAFLWGIDKIPTIVPSFTSNTCDNHCFFWKCEQISKLDLTFFVIPKSMQFGFYKSYLFGKHAKEQYIWCWCICYGRLSTQGI